MKKQQLGFPFKKHQKRIGILLFFCLIFVSISPFGWFNQQKTDEIQPDPKQNNPTTQPLSLREQQYLVDRGPVTLCVDPDWEPYEWINEDGEHVGIAADLVKLISSRSGVPLKLVKTRNWQESIAASKDGRCELLSFLNQTQERDEWLLFTDPYFTDPNVFITREEHSFIANPASLTNETMVLPAGTSMEERIRQDYPNLTILIVESESQAVQMVSERKADMTLRSLTMAAYIIKKEGLFNLKISGQLPAYTNQFRMASIQTEPMLIDILNKGIQTISDQQVAAIVNQHISINVQSKVDYRLVAYLVVGFSFFILLGLLWITQLRNLNKKLAARQAALVSLSQQLEEDIAVRKKTEDTLRKSEDKYRTLIDSANEIIVVIQDRVACLVNQQTVKLTGYTEEELTSQPFLAFVDPMDHEIVNTHHHARLQGEFVPNRYEIRLLDKHGKSLWFINSGVKIEWEGSPATLNFLTDISDRKKLEIDLMESEEKYRYMTENTSDVLWHMDENFSFDYISQADERMRGFETEEVIGKTVWSLLKPEGIEHVKRVNEKRLEDEKNGITTGTILYELEQIRKDGSWLWTEINVSPHHDPSGKLIGYHGVTRDISEQKRLKDELQRQAILDDLTGLFNRRHFLQLATLELKRAIRFNHPLSVVMLDIDHLKTINDTFGHAAGDKALKTFARVCSQNCRAIDVLSRFGGDEFVLLMPETDSQQALAVIERIQAVLAVHPISFERQSKSITLSAGIASFSSAQETLDALMKRADQMLYQAKQAGRDCVKMDQTELQSPRDDRKNP